MKRIIGISLALALILPVIASAAITLPDYQKLVPNDKLTCDSGATSVNQYETNAYTLIVIITKQGGTIYNLGDSTGEQFIYQSAGSPDTKNISKDESGAILKEFAVNFYNFIFKAGPSDCK